MKRNTQKQINRAYHARIKNMLKGFESRFEKEEFDADGNPEWIIEIVKDTKILKYEHAGRYCVEMEGKSLSL